MADHLGEWRCKYCHFKARTGFGWKKHCDNFHDGIDPRTITHIEPEEYSLACFVCRNAGRDIVICPNVSALCEHIEGIHYRSLDENCFPLEWFERIFDGIARWLAFEDYYHHRGEPS